MVRCDLARAEAKEFERNLRGRAHELDCSRAEAAERAPAPESGHWLRSRTLDRPGSATSQGEMIVERFREEFEAFDGASKGWTERR